MAEGSRFVLATLPPGTRITHAGESYGAGVGPSYYGVWKLGGLDLLATYPPTAQGWAQAWTLYQELETSVQTIRIHRFNNPFWPLFHLLFALMFIPIMEYLGIYVATSLFGKDTNRMGGELGVALMVILAVIGWFLLIYLWPKRVRFLVGWGTIAIGFVIGLVSVVIDTPLRDALF